MSKINIKKLSAVLAVLLLAGLLLAGAGAADTGGSLGYGLSWTVDDNNHLTITYDGVGTGVMPNYGNNCGPWGSSIKSLSLPDGLTSIGNFAFYNCKNLSGNLTIPSSVTTIGNCAFYGCSGLTGSLIIPSSVTKIDYQAFYDCSGFNGNLVLPSSLTEIGGCAFGGCSGLTGNLTIPSSINTIEQQVFIYCSGFTGDLVIPSGITSIGWYAFKGCTGISSVEIPSTVTTIEYEAFYYCEGLTGSVIIPSSVTKLGGSTFKNCDLSCIMLPGSLTDIGSDNFVGNALNSIVYTQGDISILSYSYTKDKTALSKDNGDNSFTFTLKDSSFPTGLPLTTKNAPIKEGYTFGGWYDNAQYSGNMVTTVTNGQTLYAKWYQISGTCGDGLTWSVDNDNHLTILYDGVGTGIMTDYAQSSTGPWGEEITSVSLPSGLKHIGNYAFNNCNKLTGNLILPSSVTTIGDCAIRNCNKLTGSLTIPSGVTTIGQNAFDGCSGFTNNLVLPSGLTSIPSCAFQNCYGFTGALIIPSGVTSIGEAAFNGCSGFSGNITLHSRIISIGDGAFSNCGGILNIYVESNNSKYMDINGVVFSKDGTKLICCPAGKVVDSYNIPSGVISIGNHAFSYCSRLTGKIVIPSSVTSIGGWAFCGCSGINCIILPENLSNVESTAFYYLANNSIIYTSGNTAILSEKYTLDRTAIAKDNGNESFTFTVNNASFQSGFPLTESNAPIKEGYTFKGWYDNAQYEGDMVTTVTNGHTIYALWENDTKPVVNAFYYVLGLNEGDHPLLIPGYTYNDVNGYSFSVPYASGWYLTPDMAPEGIYYHMVGTGSSEYDQIVYVSHAKLTYSAIDNNTIYVEETGDEHYSTITVENSAGMKPTLIFEKEERGIFEEIPYVEASYTDNTGTFKIEADSTYIGTWDIYANFSKDFDNPSAEPMYSKTPVEYKYSKVGSIKIAQKKEEISASMTMSTTEVSDGGIFTITVTGPKNKTGTLTDSGAVTIKYYKDGELSSEAVDMTTTSSNLNFPENQIQMISGSDRAFAISSSGQCIIAIQANTGTIWNTTYHFEVYVTGCGSEKAGGINNPLKGEIKIINNSDPGYPETLKLRAGWNFISVPMSLDSSMDTAGEFFEEVDMDNHSVLGYDSSTKSWVQLTASTILKPLDAYWVYSKENFEGTKTITFDTQSPSVGNTKAIYKGWNAVGLNIDVTDGTYFLSAKSTFAGLDWNRYFEKYTTGAWKTIVNGGSSSESEEKYIYAGAGGWLYANENGTLIGNAS